jgi:hypothetical protein
MTVAKCVGPEKAAEQLLFPRPFWYFLWQCQKVHIKKKSDSIVTIKAMRMNKTKYKTG